MLSVEQFFDPTVVIAGKLILAMLLGTVIGTERAILAKQSAGMRTFGIVALGSCLFIVVANMVSLPYVGIMNFAPPPDPRRPPEPPAAGGPGTGHGGKKKSPAPKNPMPVMMAAAVRSGSKFMMPTYGRLTPFASNI